MTENLKSYMVLPDERRLWITECGTGPMVLFVHGFPEGWSMWRHQLKAVAAAGYRAVALDMRGYGRSFKPAKVSDYSVLKLIDDLKQVVKALGETKAVIVGHDWGSAIAWTAAWTHPDIFHAVVGMSVPFGGRSLIPFAGASSFGERRPSEAHLAIAGPGGGRFYQEYWSVPGLMESEIEPDVRRFLSGFLYSFSGDALPEYYVAPDLDKLTAEDVIASARSSALCVSPGDHMLDALQYPDMPFPAWLGEKLDTLAPIFEATGFTPALNWYRALELSWEELGEFGDCRVTVPALFIAGEADPPIVWGIEAMRAFGRTVPNLTATMLIPRTGHWVAEEKPEIVNQALVDFLRHIVI